MSLNPFTSAAELSHKIDTYFNYIEGEYHIESKPGKEGKEEATPTIKVWDREPEPATFAGLTLFLGFNSRQAFDDYELSGEFAEALKRGRLRIEVSYEKKLHNQSAAGAIFALKSMGWNDRAEPKTASEQIPKSLKIEILESGPKLAASEKEVVM